MGDMCNIETSFYICYLCRGLVYNRTQVPFTKIYNSFSVCLCIVNVLTDADNGSSTVGLLILTKSLQNCYTRISWCVLITLKTACL
jgi:choline-glycine betaine transporter